MSWMRRVGVLVLLVLVAWTPGCVVYPVRGEVEFQEAVAFEGVRAVAVETRNGSVEVQCSAEQREVEVRGTKFARGVSVEDARAHAEEIAIQIERDAGEAGLLRIAARFPEPDDGRGRGASFRIALPAAVSLRLKTSNGLVKARGARGDVRARTSNGAVEVVDIEGEVVVRTSNGKVVAREVRGDVDVSSSNGEIELERVGRGEVSASTSNGRIRAVETSGNVRLRSSNGAVEVRAASVPEEPRIKASTSNGRVAVLLPATVKATLRMRTSNGRLSAELDGAEVTDFESGRHRLEATLNGGGGKVEMESSNGALTFRTLPGGKS